MNKPAGIEKLDIIRQMISNELYRCGWRVRLGLPISRCKLRDDVCVKILDGLGRGDHTGAGAVKFSRSFGIGLVGFKYAQPIPEALLRGRRLGGGLEQELAHLAPLRFIGFEICNHSSNLRQARGSAVSQVRSILDAIWLILAMPPKTLTVILATDEGSEF